jgi:hypothetical protein
LFWSYLEPHNGLVPNLLHFGELGCYTVAMDIFSLNIVAFQAINANLPKTQQIRPKNSAYIRTTPPQTLKSPSRAD